MVEVSDVVRAIESARYLEADAMCLKLTREQDLEPVVRAWLDGGEVARARKIYQLIVEPSPALSQEFIDCAEADRYGVSVYPKDYPIEKRWVRPRFVPKEGPTGAARHFWAPGYAYKLGEEIYFVYVSDARTFVSRITNIIYPHKKPTTEGDSEADRVYLEAATFEDSPQAFLYGQDPDGEGGVLCGEQPDPKS